MRPPYSPPDLPEYTKEDLVRQRIDQLAEASECQLLYDWLTEVLKHLPAWEDTVADPNNFTWMRPPNQFVLKQVTSAWPGVGFFLENIADVEGGDWCLETHLQVLAVMQEELGRTQQLLINQLRAQREGKQS